MKMVKERKRTMSAVNDERRQLLPPKAIWDETISVLDICLIQVYRKHI
jgi:hypothetical protein